MSRLWNDRLQTGIDSIDTQHKVLCQADAVFMPNGEAVRGYEIHHGETCVTDGQVQPVMTRAD